MHKTISDRSVLYADECSSYPSTAFALGVEHRWVNHCVGFRGDNGTHTNTIEGFRKREKLDEKIA